MNPTPGHKHNGSKDSRGCSVECLSAGNILAVATIKPLESAIDISGVAQGMEMMGAGSVLYPALNAGDLILANIIVAVLGLLTSLLPAWRASTYDPVEAINKT